MPTLYVENVPNDLYLALRKRAKANRRSMAAEVLSVLEQMVPTESTLRKRRDFWKWVQENRASAEESGQRYPTAEELIREDRER